MNENVNISFIPKKPLARDEALGRHRPVLGVSFLIIFVIALVFIGCAVCEFFYIEAKEQEKAEMIKKLEDYNNELKADDLIKDLKEVRAFAQKITLVKSLLDRHVASTELFSFLERTTPTQVSFKDFNFNNTKGDVVQLDMSGQAASYEVLAALSELYKQEKEVLLGYTLTNFALDDEGRVSFNFVGTFAPSLISYPQIYQF